jgi:hypothetical protein
MTSRIPVVSVDLVQLTAAERSVAHKIDSIMPICVPHEPTCTWHPRGAPEAII